MKLSVLQEDFSKALNFASRFSSSRTQLPVLANIKLEAKKNRLVLMSTNLEISSVVKIGAQIEKEGSVTVPSRVMTDIVQNLPSGALNINVDKEKIEISTSSFKGSVSGMNDDDFPNVPVSAGTKKLKLDKDVFGEVLSQTLYSVSTDETRPVLTGMLVVIGKSSLVFASTDGFRLSQKKINVKNSGDSGNVIIPKNILGEIMRLSNDFDEISFSIKKKDNQIVFEAGEIVVSSRILEGEFPDYKSIIPKSSKLRVIVDKEELQRSVKLASVFARESDNVVKFLLKKDKLEVLADSKTSGKQKTSLDVKTEKGSVDVEIAFNYRFLEELLNSIKGEEVVMELTDSKSPGVFTDPKDASYLHLIMPVKVQGS